MQAPSGFTGPFRTDEKARALYAEGAGIFRIVPAAVAVPEGVEDLLALVRWAAETGTPLIPRGAGSGMPGGNVGPGVVVDMTRGFTGRPVIYADRATAKAGAAVTYRDLNGAAAGHGLRLPPDPSSGAFCTIGGMVSTNASGARTLRYGSIRGWVESIEFVTMDGEVGTADRQNPENRTPQTAVESRLIEDVAPWMRQHQLPLENAAPKTSKNSSGYLVAHYPDSGWPRHLLIGSEGTLAFITSVEVRLAPLPAERCTVLVTLASLDDVAPAVRALREVNPSACELLDRTYLDFVRAAAHAKLPEGTEAVLLVELEQADAQPAVDAVRGIATSVVAATDPAAESRLWELRHLASPILAGLPDTLRSLQVVEDGCVPLETLGEYVTGLRRVAAANGFEIVIFGHAGDAHVHANLLVDTRAKDLADRLEACLREASKIQIALGGTLSGEHGDGRLRAPFLAELYGETYVECCRRVKRAFDPAGLLNPGVKFPGEDARVIRPELLKVGVGAPILPKGVAETLREIERTASWGLSRLDHL